MSLKVSADEQVLYLKLLFKNFIENILKYLFR